MWKFLSELFRRRPKTENPTMKEMKARREAEEDLRRAEEVAKAAEERAEKYRQEAEQARQQARAYQEAADEVIARMMEQMGKPSRAAKGAEEFAGKAAKEGAEKPAREAREERERCQKMHEHAGRAMAVAEEEVDRALKAAEEQRCKAEAVEALAKGMVLIATADTQRAVEAKKNMERQIAVQRIHPVSSPTAEEFAASMQRVQYKEGYFHFAVAGISGSGKSSLINAFIGLRNADVGAAAVGITETTLQITRYPDVDPESPYVWYDIPGAGTLTCPDWQYFNDQGLYVFDCIIVLFDSRFTTTDIAILTHARRFNIPTYIVRSKADQHIRNLMADMGYDSDDEDEEHRNDLYETARKRFVEKTRESVQTNLEDANLPDQRVYIVSNKTLLGIVQKKKVLKKAIDEVDLLNDVINEAYKRRSDNHELQVVKVE